MSLLDEMKSSFNETRTLNNDVAYKSTLNPVLDFFSSSGAMRNSEDDSILHAFNAAYANDKDLALKALFYARDIRGGQGERHLFRVVLKYLAYFYPEDIIGLVEHISEYGRWDDLFVLKGTPLETVMLVRISGQLADDVKSDHPSLLGKWMPSINTSSIETKKLANWFAAKLELKSREFFCKYRNF